MSDEMSRREFELERAVTDLLDFVAHSGDHLYYEYNYGDAAMLRKMAERIERLDEIVSRARALVGYDLESHRGHRLKFRV